MEPIDNRWKDNTGFTYGFCQCLACNNILKTGNMTCKAYDIIPDKVWLNNIYHTKPLPDQKNDIVFEQKKGD